MSRSFDLSARSLILDNPPKNPFENRRERISETIPVVETSELPVEKKRYHDNIRGNAFNFWSEGKRHFYAKEHTMSPEKTKKQTEKSDGV